ncbi:MAG: ECF-type sigma factor [Blastocatellia bacterium]|jgi:RNA polymerase sigma factor (TIGR02999 family)
MNQSETNRRVLFKEEEREFSAQTSASGKGSITISLAKLQCPEMAGREEAMEAVMCQLLAIAHRKMRRTRERLGLETGELVSELVLKLYRQQPIEWQNREHFYAICSKWMSQIVIDQYRCALSASRGGNLEQVPLSDELLCTNRDLVTLLALREALNQLAKLDRRKSLIVELRFLWGMTLNEVASALNISPAGVKRDWKVGRMWLEDHLAPLAIPADRLRIAA